MGKRWRSAVGFAVLVGAGVARPAPSAAGEEKMATSVLDFTVKDIDGKEVPLSAYKGKVILVVNVASRCGYTPQYEGLEALYEKYKDRGLVVLGFPSNDFMGQEPGTDAEIKSFCSLKYNVTFPMFSKMVVKGKGQSPLYAFLTGKETAGALGGDISWNFNKFLVARSGRLVARFPSGDAPQSAKVVSALEKALEEKPR